VLGRLVSSVIVAFEPSPFSISFEMDGDAREIEIFFLFVNRSAGV
jgi:hypothetical protein